MGFLSLEEKRLLGEEDHLITKAQYRGVDDSLKDISKGLAKNWKEYSIKGRDEERNSPRTKVAIKHCLALLKFASEDKPNWSILRDALNYGRAEILSPPTPTYRVPIIDLGQAYTAEMIGLQFSEGAIPFRGSKSIPFRVMKDGDLERISSCASCPAGGVCTLKELCRGYSGTEYSEARTTKLGPQLKSADQDPTAEEYKQFALYNPK